MKRYLILLLCVKALFAQILFAQIDTSKKATLHLILTNEGKKPLVNEEIIIRDSLKTKFYRFVTNQKGEISQLISAGYLYNIYLRILQDTTYYGNINIPGLTAKQFYTTPFEIEMVYEPAKQYTFHNLEFDNGKATIRKESFAELNLLVEYLNRKTHLKVTIIGHTDNVGNDDANIKLSVLRANAVKNYLVQKGINTSRILSKGLGAAQPIEDNNTEAGKQKNRRIELNFNE